MPPQKKKPVVEAPRSSFDPRSVSWTHTLTNDAWAKMMRGGKNLLPQVTLPFEKPAQGGKS